MKDSSRSSESPDFEPMFKVSKDFSLPPYLMLLNLNRESIPAMNLLKRITSQDIDLTDQIVALLADMNWRPHLIAAIAMALGSSSPKSVEKLWQTFDSGSWVSPQLAAVASITDKDFSNNAKKRIENSCPINSERLDSTDWLTRHTAAGPESVDGHSSKALAALVALCGQEEEFTQWFEALANRETIQQAIKKDDSDSGRIAIQWLQQLDSLVKLMESSSDTDG